MRRPVLFARDLCLAEFAAILKRLAQNHHNPAVRVDEIAGQSVATAKAMRKRSPARLLRRAVIPAAGVFIVILLLAGLVGFAEKVANGAAPAKSAC